MTDYFYMLPESRYEMCLRMQVIDVHKESTKTRHISLLRWLFEDFLGIFANNTEK